MHKFTIFLLLVNVVFADDLDMFDVVDADEKHSISENNISKETVSSDFNAHIKLNYLTKDNNINTKVFYANLSDNKQDFNYALGLIANKDEYNIYIKELYYKAEFSGKYFLELGRINIKEGVARGYNPTDYFKNASTLTLSIDPKEKRDNRLGSLLVNGSYISDNYTIKALYSPKISVDNSSIFANKNHIGLQLNKSNNQNRETLYLGYTGLDDWSLSVLLHHNDDGFHLGTNISYINKRTIWYVETSTNKTKSLISKNLKIINAPNSLMSHFKAKSSLRTEITFGLNHTFENGIIGTLEYSYNSGGLGKNNWKEYFTLMKNSAIYAPILGKVRETISNNADQMSKHSIFAMARKNDAIPNLDLSVMTWINPIDKSALVEAGISYDYNNVVFSTNIRSYLGKKESEYGSMPNNYEALFSVEYFF